MEIPEKRSSATTIIDVADLSLYFCKGANKVVNKKAAIVLKVGGKWY